MWKYYNKNKIWFFLIFVFVFFGFTLAAENDCNYVGAGIKPNKIFTDEDIEVARSHLLSYCCDINKWKQSSQYPPSAYTETWKCTTLVDWPDSPYWLDHLIDVWIRKLSARELYPDMRPDWQWYEWLELLKQEQTPSMLSVRYEDFWRINHYPILTDFDYKYRAEYFLISDWVSLWDKYLNLCVVSFAMLDIRASEAPRMTEKHYESCMQLIRSKMREETIIAYNISQNAGGVVLSDAWNGFLKQFMQNRLMKLRDKIFAISWFFDIIGKQAPLSSTCNR